MPILLVIMRFSSLFLGLIMLLSLWSCHGGDDMMSSDVIAQNDKFTVTVDSVIEGDYVAAATSDRHITTNYEWRTEAQTAASVLEYRLAINGDDNELPFTKAHYARAGRDTVCRFGEAGERIEPSAADTLAGESGVFIVKVDMKPVFDSFKKRGYYVGAKGDTISKHDFRGVWIAGKNAPLTDDFRTLRSEQKYKLHATADPNVYEIRFEVHKTNGNTVKCRDWEIDKLNEHYPQYHSGQTLVDALYNMAIANVADGTAHNRLEANEAAVPIYMSLAYLAPEYSKTLLRASVDGDSLRRNASWPVVSDHALWVVAAWEVYCVTGDKDWLDYAFEVASNTLDADLRLMMNKPTGLMHGVFCPYWNWGVNVLYPRWAQGADLFETMSFGNNVAYQAAFETLGQMADALGRDGNEYGDVAAKLKETINQKFWDENAGMYKGASYCCPNGVLLPVTDNFAQAMSVLFDIADDDRAETLVGKTPVTNYGVTMMFPGLQPADAASVSGAQLQALWNLAAARVGNENMLRRGLGAMYRAEALMGGDVEFYGCYDGISPLLGGKHRSVAAAAGNAAMIFRVMAGMNFLPNGIEFDPIVPECFKGTKLISSFKYRQCTLDISIEGTGNDMAQMLVDEKPTSDNFLPDTLTGRHVVRIVMARTGHSPQNVTLLTAPHLLPEMPVVAWNGKFGWIMNYAATNGYRIVVNGSQNYSVVDSTFTAPFSSGMNLATMVSINKNGMSQMSRPYLYEQGVRLFAAEQGNGTGEAQADSTVIKINVPTSGRYYADVSYANGNGGLWFAPGCVALVSTNTHYQGAVVMPIVGSGVWGKKAHSSIIGLELVKGDNTVVLKKLHPEAAASAVKIYGLRLFGK